MKIRDGLISHLFDSQFHDRESGLILPGEDRLQHEFQTCDGGWESIASEIASREDMAWFPDANVAILDETEAAWSALRLAGIHDSRTFISEVVACELTEWLDEPRRNEERAAALRDSLKSNGWARLCRASAWRPGISAYAHLIGTRRLLCLPYSDDGLTIVGTDPNDKMQTMDVVKKTFGERALALAKKGRKDVEAGKLVTVNDEVHCMTAIIFALATGIETAILTRDADCLEIFRKAQWFMNTHYRAWAVAKCIERGEYGEPELALPASKTNGFFDGPLALYRRQTNLLPEALPHPYRKVTAHVVYVGHDGKIVRMASHFEREMLDMFQVRMTTGRCSELFGDRNIHIDCSPINAVPTGWFIGIGKDACLTLNVDDGNGNVEKTQIPALDVEHAMQCRERIMDLLTTL